MTNTQIAALVASLLAKPGEKPTRKASKTKRSKAKSATPVDREAFKAKLAADTVAAFTAAGFADVKPHENVLTFKRWVEKGRRPMPGQKAIKVGPFSMFHVDQTQPLEQAAA